MCSISLPFCAQKYSTSAKSDKVRLWNFFAKRLVFNFFSFFETSLSFIKLHKGSFVKDGVKTISYIEFARNRMNKNKIIINWVIACSTCIKMKFYYTSIFLVMKFFLIAERTRVYLKTKTFHAQIQFDHSR